MTAQTPREAVEALLDDPALPHGDDERFAGYGAMGVPFASGHYLALRSMVASSIGPAYRSVWHRGTGGDWTIHTTTAPELSCPRYFGSLTAVAEEPAIDVTWRSDWELEVTMGSKLTWRLELGRTPATALMTRMAAAMPAAAWSSDRVLTTMGPMAGATLRSGRMRLHGTTPNGPSFKIAPLHVWRVVGGGARLDGTDLGPLGRLAEQASLGDLWLPQRGLFFVANARFGRLLAAPVPPPRVRHHA